MTKTIIATAFCMVSCIYASNLRVEQLSNGTEIKYDISLVNHTLGNQYWDSICDIHKEFVTANAVTTSLLMKASDIRTAANLFAVGTVQNEYFTLLANKVSGFTPETPVKELKDIGCLLEDALSFIPYIEPKAPEGSLLALLSSPPLTEKQYLNRVKEVARFLSEKLTSN